MTVKEVPWFWSNLAVAWLVRALFVGSTIWIMILCAERQQAGQNSLMTWHIGLSTIGCGLLMIEATLVVSGDPFLSSRVSRKNRIIIHWILHTAGIAAIVVGWAVVITFKLQVGLNFLYSDHGIVGLIGYILPILVAILAIPTVCPSLVPRCLCSLANCKNFHIYFSISAYIMLWAGQFTGFNKNSWVGSAIGTDAAKLAYVVGGTFLLAKPLYTTLKRQFGRSL